MNGQEWICILIAMSAGGYIIWRLTLFLRSGSNCESCGGCNQSPATGRLHQISIDGQAANRN